MLKYIPIRIDTFINNLLILPYYHIVSDNSPQHTKHLYVCRNIKDFENDLDYLLKNYESITLKDIYELIYNGKILNGRCFHLTFDDGFRESFDIIVPILKRKGIHATFFICSDFIDNKNMYYRNKISILLDIFSNKLILEKEKYIKNIFNQNAISYNGFGKSLWSIKCNNAHLIDNIANVLEYDFNEYMNKYKPYLCKDQIENIIKDGFTIGSHSKDHSPFQNLSLEKQVEQTKISMNEIAGYFQNKVRAFAFPHSDKNITRKYFAEVNDIVDIYFGTNRMKKDKVFNLLHRFSLEDDRYTCEEIIKRNYLLQMYYNLTFRGEVNRVSEFYAE